MEFSAVSADAIPPSVERRPANFHPGVWGDFFMTFEDLEIYPEEVEQEMKQLKEEIAMVLRKTSDQSPLKLKMIDDIQRLGLSYQFEVEIKASLSNIYNKFHDADNDATVQQEDLHTVALCFRLLREQGHPVSSELLRKFVDNKGKWDKSSTSMDDLDGILSLYEACHYMVHGECILEEALIFAETALKWILSNNASDFIACSRINHALQWPIRKTANRVATRLYITLYEQDESHDEVLLKLAKLDFNALQRMHKRELCDITKWWKRIDGDKKFEFARDKRVENYFMALGIFFEPQYSEARVRLAKLLILTIVMDDAYDEYATIDELLLFTNAIERWNIESTNNLPSYMKPLYKDILDFFNEMEEDLAKYNMSKQIEYGKLEMIKATKAYYQEAYWYHNNIVPGMEEYMEAGRGSSLARLVGVISYIGMKSLFTEDVLNWADSEKPLLFRAASTITRVMDDLQDHTDGSKEAGAVKCYMSEYGVSKKKAVEDLNKQVRDAWKDINVECLHPTAVEPAILERLVNIGRILYTLFKDIDGYGISNSLTKQMVKSVIVDPINY